MSGVQVEATTDASGGQNVGYIDANDWMSYTGVNIASSGNYTIGFRVASQSGGGTLQFEQAGGGTVYGSIGVPSTGGWQTWTTIYMNVYLNAGSQGFGIKALAGGWNINWFSITPAGGSAARVSNDELVNENMALSKPYPNPFEREVAIPVNAKDGAPFQLQIYNISGKLIRAFDNKDLQEGSQEVIWSGTDSRGNTVSNGIYFYNLTTQSGSTSGKLMKGAN
ncbi:carbohydrate-binding protein [Fulvivirga ligni]|nr:carbohydrate-binding protein [Fulvivirga ligni]